MGKYTQDSWKRFTMKAKNLRSLCIYCYERADSREHIPPETFLTKPYPDNLAIVPACEKCNRGFSSSEQYTACFIDYFANIISNGISPLRDKTQKAFARDKRLFEEVSGCFNVSGSVVSTEYDTNKVNEVILKISQGHIANRLDYLVNPEFDSLEHFVVKLKPQLSPEEISAFNQMPIIESISESGSDFVQDLLVYQNSDEAMVFSPWEVVQEGEYRFLAFPSGNMRITVRIVIFEMLFAEIIYKT